MSSSKSLKAWGNPSDVAKQPGTEQAKYQNTDKTAGAVHRPATSFHDWIGKEVDGSVKYPAEAGRYRLIVSEACPWAHRCHIVWKLKGLEGIVSLSLTGWKLENIKSEPPFDDYHGWDFVQDGEGYYKEPSGRTHIESIYETASPGYRADWESRGMRPYFSVPVLFDELTNTIVSTESAEIIVMLNSAFDGLPGARTSVNLNSPEKRERQEAVNAIIYPGINDGVYRCGFARSQEAYENAYHAHWKAMDEVEDMLSKSRFLTGDTITLADVRLWTTLARYDTVYYAHFKTNRSHLCDMPNLYRFLRDFYRIEGVSETLNLEWIKKHYYWSQRMVNPTGIWPLGMPSEEKEYWENIEGLVEEPLKL
eukprot:CAMPEP_0182483102 /NCGR_PEP_ID=MMETSP1319-20130603/40636_1 /TAXON_ID=172717 /ORGANISM="Bolidomonas pacifica, Strain RCC208" /LENGTH=364 /DNA_ID=CAMNT_0024684871 /DNA_START=87 /DNA_END=1181 /DNA_ORIENTATION=+